MLIHDGAWLLAPEVGEDWPGYVAAGALPVVHGHRARALTQEKGKDASLCVYA